MEFRSKSKEISDILPSNGSMDLSQAVSVVSAQLYVLRDQHLSQAQRWELEALGLGLCLDSCYIIWISL